MKATSLPNLRCPGRRCSGPRLSVEVWEQTELVSGETDIVEAVVVCETCRAEYPVVAGVLVLVEDLTGYLKDHLGVILHLNETPPSDRMRQWLADRATDTDPRYVRRSMKLEERYVHAFLGAHYDRTPPAEDTDNPLADLLAAAASDDLWAECARIVEKLSPSTALDMGCSVGGLTAVLSRNQVRTLGFDTSFLSVSVARRALLRTPEALDTYRAYGEGDRYVEHPLAVPARPEYSDFVVASALAPTVAEPVDLTCAVNLIDLVPDPAGLLDTMVAQTRPGGHVLVTSPYGWSDVARGRWLGGSAEESSPDALRGAARERGLTVVWENRQLPWMWRDYARFWRLYLVDAVLFTRS